MLCIVFILLSGLVGLNVVALRIRGCLTMKTYDEQRKFFGTDKWKRLSNMEYEKGEPTYTIISRENPRTVQLLDEMRKCRINFVFMDIENFSHGDLISILNHYGCNYAPNKNIYKNLPLVFYENKKFIGGYFEMYEIIAKRT